MSKRNNAVEFYRFFFSQIIVLFHFARYTTLQTTKPFHSGNLAVELFLLLSGYFLARSTRMQEGRTLEDILSGNLKYMKSRFFRLYPHYLLAVLCVGFVQVFVMNTLGLKPWIKNGYMELLMLQSISGADCLSPVLWFPSALFTASFVVHFLMLWKPRLCTRFLFPIAAPAIVASLIDANGVIFATQPYHFLFSSGFWRALAEIMLGCVCYDIVQSNKKERTGKAGGVLCALLELGLLLVLCYLFYTPQFRSKSTLVLLLSMAFLILVFSQESCLSRLLNNKASAYLGKISYAVYLNQIVFTVIGNRFFPFPDGTPVWLVVAACMAANVLLSMLTTWMVEKVSLRLEKGTGRLLSLIGW